MVDIYLSSLNNRMNAIMKVLTIIATIFMPLTFLAGVYGMNFKYMPELEWPWGYPLVVAVMAGIGSHDADSVQAEEMALKIKGPSGRGRSRALQNENCKLQNAYQFSFLKWELINPSRPPFSKGGELF